MRIITFSQVDEILEHLFAELNAVKIDRIKSKSSDSSARRLLATFVNDPLNIFFPVNVSAQQTLLQITKLLLTFVLCLVILFEKINWTFHKIAFPKVFIYFYNEWINIQSPLFLLLTRHHF